MRIYRIQTVPQEDKFPHSPAPSDLPTEIFFLFTSIHKILLQIHWTKLDSTTVLEAVAQNC